MKAKLYEFPITDFEEVYAVIDSDKKRLHISPVNYSFNITLDLTRDLESELIQNTKYLEKNFNAKAHQVAKEIVEDLKGGSI